MVQWNQQSQLPTTESTTNKNSTIDSAIHHPRQEKNSDFIKNDKWQLKNDFILINKTYYKHCNNSLYRVWWYLSYGAENKLFYFILFIYFLCSGEAKSWQYSNDHKMSSQHTKSLSGVWQGFHTVHVDFIHKVMSEIE